MKLYLAPIQGMTNAHYRNHIKTFFGGYDAYYAPFISPTSKQETHPNFFKDILQSKNDPAMNVVPQLLGNNGCNFRTYANTITEMGYKEINWNIGCSFLNVTKKNKGSGILKHPEMVSNFLDEVCRDGHYNLTVKMRLGQNSVDEGLKIIEVLNNYPISNVIIHARTGIQHYNGPVDLDGFNSLYKASHNPITYNGDLFTLEDYKSLIRRFPDLNHIMLGRGALRNPFLANDIKGIHTSDEEKFQQMIQFHQTMFDYYEKNTYKKLHLLNRIKEFWTYSHLHLDPEERFIKNIRLATTLEEYDLALKQIFHPSNKWHSK